MSCFNDLGDDEFGVKGDYEPLNGTDFVCEFIIKMQ